MANHDNETAEVEARIARTRQLLDELAEAITAAQYGGLMRQTKLNADAAYRALTKKPRGTAARRRTFVSSPPSE